MPGTASAWSCRRRVDHAAGRVAIGQQWRVPAVGAADHGKRRQSGSERSRGGTERDRSDNRRVAVVRLDWIVCCSGRLQSQGPVSRAGRSAALGAYTPTRSPVRPRLGRRPARWTRLPPAGPAPPGHVPTGQRHSVTSVSDRRRCPDPGSGHHRLGPGTATAPTAGVAAVRRSPMPVPHDAATVSRPCWRGRTGPRMPARHP